MSIRLFTEIIQPFGILSNNAQLPVDIDGRSYTSVTNYVYKNIIQQLGIKDYIYGDPLGTILRHMYISDRDIFMNAMIDAMTKRYHQDVQLHKKLTLLEDSQLNFTPSLFNLCNTQSTMMPTFFHRLSDNTILLDSQDNESMCNDLNMRLIKSIQLRNKSKTDVFIDSVHGKLEMKVVNDMIYNMAMNIVAKPNVYDNLTDTIGLYKAYKNKIGRRNVGQVMEYKFINSLHTIDDIVSKLKIKLREKIYKRKIDDFKTHLLDVALDYILETRYGHLHASQYTEAKNQQIQKKNNTYIVNNYKEILYNKYNNRTLDNNILHKLNPDKIPVEILDTEVLDTEVQDDDDNELLQNLLPNNVYNVASDDILMPHYTSNINIRDETYRSAVAYAYAQLFIQHRFTYQENDDSIVSFVNRTPLPELAQEYHKQRHSHLTKVIMDLNETATRVKFTKYPELKTLLYCTIGKNISYENPLDYVLGSGLNECGKLLVKLRNTMNTDRLPRGFQRFNSDAVVKEWFNSRLKDYANTLRLFSSSRNVQDLCLIYDVSKEAIDMPERNYLDQNTLIGETFTENGIDRSDIKIVLPCIFLEFLHIRNGYGIGIGIADGGIQSMVKSYDLSKPNKTDEERAIAVVRKIFNKVQSRLHYNTDETKFIKYILGKNHSLPIEYWWRVHKYARRKTDDMLSENVLSHDTWIPPFEKKTKNTKQISGGWSYDYDSSRFLVYTTPGINWTSTDVISFSMDGFSTLSPDENSIVVIDESRREIIRHYINNGYRLVIFDSMKPTSENEANKIKPLIKQIVDTINLPLQMFISFTDDINRLPITGMWDQFVDKQKELYDINVNGRVHVGKKGGREPSELALDFLFALNAKMTYSTPELFFDKINAPDIGKYNFPTYNPSIQASTDTLYDPPNTTLNIYKREIIILVGHNGAGKTTFINNYNLQNTYNIVNGKHIDAAEYLKTLINMSEMSICIDDDKNVTHESRKRYEDIAHENNIPCRYFCFSLPLDHRLHNIKFRRLMKKESLERFVTDDNESDDNESNVTNDYDFLKDLQGKAIVKVNFIPQFQDDNQQYYYNMYLG
jgi:predicted NAD-dependent protein-ADP-ribosyltransferase YbiA (DUF1768 family)/predicted kinase